MHPLQARDGYGLWDTEKISLRAESPSELLLLMEVPMAL